MKNIFTTLLLVGSVSYLFAQTHDSIPIDAWITTADRTMLFQHQDEHPLFTHHNRDWGSLIIIDEMNQMQSMDGFGFALTGGSAELLMKMNASNRTSTLQQVFGNGPGDAGVNYIRLSIGASDMNSFVFSYDDIPVNATDFELKKFSLSQDMKDVVPVMKEILAINPAIKILGSPWSAPAWMKTNGAVKSGFLKKECYDVYARYFVKYIEAMKQEGINIDAITIQNEPLNANNTPSMRWYAKDAAGFIKNNIGPAFKKANIQAKIILFDHNCDRPDYPLSILSDPEAAQYVDGSGFHLYGGDISALTTVHNARPDKNLYFTEQMTVEKPGSVPMRIADAVKELIIGAPRNWSKNVLLWNLAADSLNQPHTNDGGCPMCQGAITIDGNTVQRNIAYYAVAHASRLVPAGSVRIGSTAAGDLVADLTRDEEREEVMRVTLFPNKDVLPNVAYKTPAGKTVLIVANDRNSQQYFRVQYRGLVASLKLPAGAVGTYTW